MAVATYGDEQCLGVLPGRPSESQGVVWGSILVLQHQELLSAAEFWIGLDVICRLHPNSPGTHGFLSVVQGVVGYFTFFV